MPGRAETEEGSAAAALLPDLLPAILSALRCPLKVSAARRCVLHVCSAFRHTQAAPPQISTGEASCRKRPGV